MVDDPEFYGSMRDHGKSDFKVVPSAPATAPSPMMVWYDEASNFDEETMAKVAQYMMKYGVAVIRGRQIVTATGYEWWHSARAQMGLLGEIKSPPIGFYADCELSEGQITEAQKQKQAKKAHNLELQRIANHGKKWRTR